ncbi:Rha family transcriptional regulator [Prevotella histicola]|uniref:Rha family transcriptional regulator n=1 Tax=Prevotella histicola TaxID=470565 RepID=UPI000689897B|nr:Rha family transcriptional regulator [Prevotella histicola]
MENNELVFKGENSQALTNSLLVAEKFGKEHGDVLKAIDALMSKMSDNQCKGYFDDTSIEVSQPNGGVRYSRVVVMNRDGFTLLVMGFTGKKALQFKLDYIAAFNAMENELRKPKQMTLSEQLLMQAQFNVEQEKRISAVEQRLDNMDKEREENGRLLLEAKLSDIPTPQQSVRSRINELVCEYARATNTAHRDVWNTIYKKLKYLYHISINSYKKVKPTETKLDVVERIGSLENVLSIISEMINDFKEKTA